METRATGHVRYLRIAPRKTRLVANVIKNLSVNEAEARLIAFPNRVSAPLLKLLRSVVANAKNNTKLDPAMLYIKEIRVDQGPKLRRWTPRARGGSSRIEKKTSHISIALEARGEGGKPRFTIHKKETKKSLATEKKTDKKAEKHGESETKGTAETQKTRKGIIPKIFRRKSV